MYLYYTDAVNGRQTQNTPSGEAGTEAVDCMVSPWLEWSPCSVSCGTGHSERRRMIKRPAENGGRPCPTRLVKRRACVGQAGRNC